MAVSGDDILYLSAADVQACGLTPADINAAVEAAFLAAARGTAETRAVLSIPAGGRASFRAKGGVLKSAGFGAVKWYGYFPGNAAAGRPEYRPLILLNETDSGYPLAIMNGDWITAVRTAAITAVGAKYLARPGVSRVGFVGCGAQARTNLEALLGYFPITSAIACGRRRETAEAFAAFARARDVAMEVTDDPRRAVAEAGIVVTSVPRLSPHTQFLDPAWVAPGGFVSMVDSGVSWQPDSLARFTRRFTDDVAQSAVHAEAGDAVAVYDCGLADVVAGMCPGRLAESDRIALNFSGTGLADAAAAVAVYERAVALRRGVHLAL